MNAHDAAVEKLEVAIVAASAHRRIENLRRVTDLFVAGCDTFSEEQLAVFDRLLERLIERIEAAVLAEVGERLAPIKNAPVAVMRNLAKHDEIAVAGPILTRSEQLAPDDLVEIAETKGQAHLMAISNRAHIDEAVTDVLVRRGNDEVVRTLAANEGARFSEAGMGTLAGRAETDEMLAESVLQRADVPHHIFCRLLVAATGVVRERLLALVGPEAIAEAGRVLERVSGSLADRAPAPRAYGAAIRRVLIDSAPGQLSELDLLKYASNQQVDETIATLSLLSSVPTETIELLLTREQHESLLIICKAAGLSWLGAQAVALLNRASTPPARETLIEFRRQFDRLTEDEAQHMLKVWQPA